MKNNIFNAVDNADKHGIAIEALIQAEEQFMRGDYDPKELQEDEGFTKMAYKDDDGYWRVTGFAKKYCSHEDLMYDFPDLC